MKLKYFLLVAGIIFLLLLAESVSANPHITVTGAVKNNTIHGNSFVCNFETPHHINLQETTARIIYSQGLATVGWIPICADDGEYAGMSSCWSTTTNIAPSSDNVFRGSQSIKGEYDAGDVALKYDGAQQVFYVAEFFIAQNWGANAGQNAPYIDLVDEQPYVANWYRVRRSSASAFWEEYRSDTAAYDDFPVPVIAAGEGQAGTSWEYFEFGGYYPLGFIYTLGKNWTVRDNVTQSFSGSSYIDYFNLGAGTNSFFYMDNIRIYNTTPTLNETASLIKYDTLNFTDAFNTVRFYWHGDDVELMFSCNNNTPSQWITVNDTELTCTGSQLSQQLTAWVNLTSVNGNTTYINITVREDLSADTLPPKINITYPANSEHINTDFAVIGWAQDETGVSNVTINISGMTLTSNQTGTGNLYINFNFSDSLADGHYVANVTVNDTSGNTNSSVISFTVDTITPEITVTNPINNTSYDASFPLAITCSDNNPYLLNFTFYQGDTVIESQQDDTAPLSLSDTIDTSGQASGIYYLNVSCSDTHTLKEIPDYDVSKDILSREIIFNGISIKLISSDVDLDVKDIQYEKLSDRYTFDFGKSVSRGKYIFEITSPHVIKSINSRYLAHMITGRYWIDFENDDITSTARFIRINDNKMRVELITSSLNFASIGGLNIAEEYYLLYIDHSAPNVTATAPANNTITNESITQFNCSAQQTTPTEIKNISIYINNSVNGVHEPAASSIDYSFNITLSNGFYIWRCEACSQHEYCNTTGIYNLNVNVSVPPSVPEVEGEITFSSCMLTQDDFGLTMGLIFFFVLSFGVLLLGFYLRHAIVGFSGGFMLLFCSLFLYPCFIPLGFLMSMVSLWLMYYFIFNGWYGRL